MIPRIVSVAAVTDRKVTLYLDATMAVQVAPGALIWPAMLVIRWIDGNLVRAVLEGPRIKPDGSPWYMINGVDQERGQLDVLETPLDWTRQLIEEYAE